MGDEIGFGGSEESGPNSSAARRLIPMKVGAATVYVEQVGTPAEVGVDDLIYAAAPGTDDAFEKATEILQEYVRVVGERVVDLGEGAAPRQVRVEFSLSLEAKGEARIVPVLLTGEAKATSGFRVTAVWGDLDGS